MYVYIQCLYVFLPCVYIVMYYVCMFVCAGTAPELLFKPCDLDSTDDSSCFAYSVDGRTFKHDPIIRLEKKVDLAETVNEDYTENMPPYPPSPSPLVNAIATGDDFPYSGAGSTVLRPRQGSMNETVSA